MKIAIAQLNPTIGDLQGNSQGILKAAARAAEQGARLMLTPELSLCGYPPRDLLLNPSFIGAIDRQLANLARELPPNLPTLVGTVQPNPTAAQTGHKPLFNSIALLSHGKCQTFCHKRLLPTYDVFDESRYFTAGANSGVIAIDSVLIGITICEDLWNEEEFWGKRSYTVNPIAELVQAGVDLLVNLSASPYSVGKPALRERMLSYSAKRYGQPIIYANQVGGNDDLIFDGASFACDRQGRVVCRAAAFTPDLVMVDFQAQELTSSTCPEPETSPEAEIWSALVLGVKDYMGKCGFHRATLGLSGGVDSSLVAAIAAAAIGPENVLGVLMPSPYSSEHSVTDALALATNLGIKTQTLPIGPLMQSYNQTLGELFQGTDFGVAEENIQSRIRGNLLMAIANKFGYLLLSTGNKSEMAVGYCTLYGDMNGGLAVIADVPKTQVYALCHWLNRTQTLIPPAVLTKAPSAELKPDQRDQDSLPPYEVLDDILDRLLLEHQSPRAIVQAGHDPTIVKQVINLVTKAEFKRRQAPPGLKVTDRAFGTGWRMPIAARWLYSDLD